MRNAEKKKRRQSQLLGRWSCNFSQNSCCLWAIKKLGNYFSSEFEIEVVTWENYLRLLVVGSATRLTHTQPHNFLATNVNIKKRNFGLFIKRVSDSRLRGCTKILIQLYCKYFPLNSRFMLPVHFVMPSVHCPHRLWLFNQPKMPKFLC